MIDLQFVDKYCLKLMGSEEENLKQDFIQEIWLQICEVKDEKWADLWSQGTKTDKAKAVRGFVSGLIYRNIRSKNSKAYYHLKKHMEKEVIVDDAAWNYYGENLEDE